MWSISSLVKIWKISYCVFSVSYCHLYNKYVYQCHCKFCDELNNNIIIIIIINDCRDALNTRWGIFILISQTQKQHTSSFFCSSVLYSSSSTWLWYFFTTSTLGASLTAKYGSKPFQQRAKQHGARQLYGRTLEDRASFKVSFHYNTYVVSCQVVSS